MHPWIHKPLGLAVDYAAFRMLNFWHWRHHIHASTPRELEEYRLNASDRTDADYFGIEGAAAVPLEDRPDGRPRTLIFDTPHPCDIGENNRVVVDVFQTRPWEGAPVLIFLHGFMSASDTGYRLWARLLNRRGSNALFFHLPYHYARRPAGYVSGELAISSNIVRLAEGLRQAVKEQRVVLQTLRNRGARKVGLFGMSYGGWVSALTASVETPDMVVLCEPIVDIEHVMWESLAARTMRRQLQDRGVTRELLSPMIRKVNPLVKTTRVPGRDMLFLAGEYDRIGPPEYVEALARKWGAHYRMYRQGHCGYKLQHAGWKDMQELLLERFLG
ncbi:MAG: alpha/beta hydrolase [Verrucomicrobiae bacterium]|nr:alpha/beta hydrolase [Verrucomicrobiae bacterium]